MTINDRMLADEAARLRALMRYAILDTPEEPQFERIVSLVRQTLGVPICAVTFIDTDRQWIKAKCGIEGNEVPRSDSFCSYAIKQRGSFIVEDATRHPLFADNPFVNGPPFVRSYLGIPLRTPEGYQVGSLCAIDTKPRRFSEIEIVTGFAELVIEQLEWRLIASTDLLTGLRTRRDWVQQTRREIALAHRHGRPMSVALLDIDHFKRINDTHGHVTGDRMLEKLSQIMGDKLRSTDIVGRVGGEEFAVTLPESDCAASFNALDQLRASVEQAQTELQDGSTVGCTISIGVAGLTQGEDTVDTLYDRADRALYASKAAGRNKVSKAD